ncbi:glycosyltransferase family 4 protein [Blastopirellula marina]|uniref:Colanic acid biosynthesis glycosyltransferase WcaL n=1 Tax=Blastopirellula marina TaxID=124 RepID=A0A2S8GNK9_9BACT|nr:glycosyltransferase family 4 protein [Blastopirellula marina]PQO46010.1 colanic acid biosynthesis glycosyltransferase WcaL [Blastopirellula marina]
MIQLHPDDGQVGSEPSAGESARSSESAPSTGSVKIAYLVNQYPSTSHSFIRREIQALEAIGVSVSRFSIRDTGSLLIDSSDKEEHRTTESVLSTGILALLCSACLLFLLYPLKFLRTLAICWRCGGRARSRLRHLFYLIEAAWLARRLANLQIQHVHSHFGTNSTTVAMLCASLLSKGTFSFTVHGPEEFDRPDSISLTEKIERSAFVVAISSFGSSQLKRWCALKHWGKIYIVHCGLEDQYLQSAAPVNHSRQIVCLGRLCEQKGQLVLIQAIRRLHDQGIGLEAVFVGDGPMRGEIESLIAASGLQHVVRIIGWQDCKQVMQWIRESHCMVLPSFAEGLPVAIMESLALGRPVISTYVAGIPELVTTECGWLTPAGDVTALAEAISHCLSLRTDELQHMADVGAMRVEQRHSIRHEARKLRSLFEGDFS